MAGMREMYIAGSNTPGSAVNKQERFEELGGRGSYPILRQPTQGEFRPMADEKGRIFELYNRRGLVDPYPDKRKSMFNPSMMEAMNLQPYNKKLPGIMQVADNSIANTFNKIKEGYQQVEPYLPDVDIGDKSIGYDYERPMGSGVFSLGGEYDFDDNQYGLDFGYKFSFDDGGIATLAGDLEQRMTPPDPQNIDPKRLTDEQKDYLYDYMLDFMFKQKQREQMENEGRIPPFNYFDMEV